MTTPLELHGAETGNCIRVSIALEEAEIPYVVHLLDLRAGEHRGAAHLAINPAGKVPTIIDRKEPDRPFILSQSNAIILYAAGRASGRLLPAAEGRERALALERFFYFITDVVAVSHAAFALRFQDEAGAMAFLDERALAALCQAEAFVSASPFMAGESFSIADIAAFTVAISYRDQLNWSALPNLDRWRATIEARPALQRGLHAFDKPD